MQKRSIKNKNTHNITIGFSTTKKLSSRFIRWATNSSCSHTFIAFDDTALNMRMVMHAEAWGYELQPWRRWIRRNILVAEFIPVGRSLDGALHAIAKSLGVRFDVRSAIIIGIKSKLTFWYKSRFSLDLNRSPWKLTCSEAVVRFLDYGGYSAARGLNPENTSPGELLDKIIRDQKEFRVYYLYKRYMKFDKNIAIPSSSLKRKYVFKKDRDPKK
jgi:hypothetical protein